MRIALFTNTFLPTVGGLEWKVHFLATKYYESGHDVVVFRPKPSRSVDGPLPFIPKYELKYLGLRPFSGYTRLGIAPWLITQQVAAYHQRKPIDIVHSHSIDITTKYAVLIKRKINVPVVATTCGHDIISMPSVGNYWESRTDPKYEKMIGHNMRCVDAVGAISRGVRKELESIGTTAKILDIPNGVDWDSFQVAERDYFQTKLNLPKSAISIVSLGRNCPQKDFKTGIEAFALIAKNNPNVHYIVAGTNAMDLRDQAGKTGCGDRIHLMNTIPMTDVPKLLWSADIFFCPSIVEGFAQVVVQAMACARPCVLSKCCGNEDFEGSSFASLGRVGDAASLANALGRFVEMDPGHRKILGLEAHAASKKFAWRVIADSYLTEFELLRQKP